MVSFCQPSNICQLLEKESHFSIIEDDKENGIILPAHKQLKLSRDARLDLVELRGELGPELLLCR